MANHTIPYCITTDTDDFHSSTSHWSKVHVICLLVIWLTVYHIAHKPVNNTFPSINRNKQQTEIPGQFINREHCARQNWYPYPILQRSIFTCMQLLLCFQKIKNIFTYSSLYNTYLNKCEWVLCKKITHFTIFSVHLLYCAKKSLVNISILKIWNKSCTQNFIQFNHIDNTFHFGFLCSHKN